MTLPLIPVFIVLYIGSFFLLNWAIKKEDG